MTEQQLPGEGEPSSGFRPVQFISGLNIEESAILDNIRANIDRDMPVLSLRKAVVCGGGPSLADDLDAIAEKQKRGFHVYALNNSVKMLKAHGIKPNAQFIIDARPGNLEFVSDPDPDITYFLAAQCNPALFDALDGFKRHMVFISAVDGAVELIGNLRPGTSVLMSAPTVGLQSLNLLDVLGYRVVHLHGFDSSNRDGAHHAYPQALNDAQQHHEFKFNGKSYECSGPMASQAEHFILSYRRYVTRGMTLQVFGEGLLPDMWRFHEVMREHGSIEQKEVVKYEKIWTSPLYRLTAPGEKLTEQAIEGLGISPGHTVIDFGCGTGRAAQKFHDKGFSVRGVDFATNCLDADVKINFVKAILWDLPHMIADAAFCTDVMEHIPTEKVGQVLTNIRRCAPRAFFHISFRPDEFGVTIGETLHLTVRPMEWWLAVLREHWANVEFKDGSFICNDFKRSVAA